MVLSMWCWRCWLVNNREEIVFVDVCCFYSFLSSFCGMSVRSNSNGEVKGK